MKKTIFTGCAPAIVTPFAADGSVDYEVFGQLVEFQINGGVDGIVVCGTTGESSTLTDDEHKKCIEFVVKKVNKRVPVIAGTGSNDTAYAVELSKEAENLGADALLLVTPYYNKTSQKGLIKHFLATADATNIPNILYNVPSRTGVNIAIDTYVALSKHPNITAVKEASPDIVQIAKILAACGSDLDVYSGNDDMATAAMAVGAKGLISVAANVIPKEMTQLTHFALENNIKKSSEIQIKYIDFICQLFCEVNPIPVKAALELMGYSVGTGRLPLCEMEESNFTKLKNSMAKLGLIK